MRVTFRTVVAAGIALCLPFLSQAAMLSKGSIQPLNASTGTVLKAEVTYYGTGTNWPAYVRLVLNGTNVQTMLPVNPAATNLAEGVRYVWSNRLARGQYTFRFETPAVMDAQSHPGLTVADLGAAIPGRRQPSSHYP